MKQLNSSQVHDLLEAVQPPATFYLVGAGGCGMSGLGHLLLDLGFAVAGSDLVENDEVRQLRERGAQINIGHEGAQVAGFRPVLVAYSSAVSAENPELATARQLEIPVARRAALLAALQMRQRGICVAGMHGKTTTTALLAFALHQLKASPSHAVGAMVPQLGRCARFNGGPRSWFVAEADESDGTLCEFQPEHAVVLNLDEEHLDHFGTFEAVCGEFEAFARKASGAVVYCADDPHLSRLFGGWKNALSYGYSASADYRVELTDARAGGAAAFSVWRSGKLLGVFTTQLFGEKNASNAAAVVALLHHLGYDADEIAPAIAPFRGAGRRQEELYRDGQFRVFDDYGHHPLEIEATLKALKTLGGRRLLVAFQPHRYSRTRDLLAEFASCFRAADMLWITEIYAASERPIAGVSGMKLTEAIRSQGQGAEYVPDLPELVAAVKREAKPGDLILFLGAGDITQAAHRLADVLRSEAAERRAALAAELAAELSPDTVLKRDELLAKRTTMRVGGKADFFAEPASEKDLAAILKFCSRHGISHRLLGRGSNLLIHDHGFHGMIISLAHPEFSRVEIDGSRMRCGAGAKLKTVSVEARRNGIAGLEFLEGIPGSVGGALRMNAGAMGSSTFDAVESIRYMSPGGEVCERPASEVEVRYRSCPLFKDHIALGAVFKGNPAPREVIEQRMGECSRKRWDSQPAAPSAGCIFKNPATIPAGKLIEELGLKGMRVGGAVVSEVHGNFIVNDGSATAQDVLSLIALVKQRARAERGIELETEVEIVG